MLAIDANPSAQTDTSVRAACTRDHCRSAFGSCASEIERFASASFAPLRNNGKKETRTTANPAAALVLIALVSPESEG